MQRISITNPQNIIDGTAKKYYFKLRNTGGPKGDKGDKGDTGATGPQGPQGNAATVSVGSTTTLPVGYDATVTNAGSIYNAVLDFGIPQGPQGPQGAKGDKGDTGAKGDTGPRGPQGERGTNATVYIGTTTTLNPGSQATVYNSGTDSNAVLNFGIPKGEKGDTGPMPTIAQTTGQAIDQVMSQKATTDALNTKQATITNSNKLSADLVTDTTTTNKFVTTEEKTTWNAKQNALTAGTGIDITSDVISTPALVPEVVASLPAEGTEGKLYLTPKNYTRGTGTGNPITATIADEAGKIESFQLYGDTFQQSYSGSNLLNAVPATSGYLNGLSATIENDGSIHLTGVSTANYSNFSATQVKTLAAGNYVLSVDKKLPFKINLRVFYSDSTTETFYRESELDLPISLAKQVTSFYIYAGSTISGTTYDETFKAWLSSGATATSFEPYVGGQASPNPDYPQPIQTVTGEQTVTINSTDYPISLGSLELCKLGTYQDYIYKDGEVWKVHRANGYYALTDSVSITPGIDTSQPNTTRFQFTNILAEPSSTSGRTSLKCSHFKYSSMWNTDVVGIQTADYAQESSNTRFWFRIPKTIATTFNQLKSWLTNNPVKLYYPLATATDTIITNQALIDQLEAVRTASLQNGTNTITNTATGSNLAGDMEIGYYGLDPISRYDEYIWRTTNNSYEQINDTTNYALVQEVVDSLPSTGDSTKLYLVPREYTGKNLLPPSLSRSIGYLDSKGNIYASNQKNEATFDFLKVKPNTTYTFKIAYTTDTIAANYWFGIGAYTTASTTGFISMPYRADAGTNNYATFTTPSGTNYIRISGRYMEHAVCQLEQGYQATDYEPYKQTALNEAYDKWLWSNNAWEQVGETEQTEALIGNEFIEDLKPLMGWKVGNLSSSTGEETSADTLIISDRIYKASDDLYIPASAVCKATLYTYTDEGVFIREQFPFATSGKGGLIPAGTNFKVRLDYNTIPTGGRPSLTTDDIKTSPTYQNFKLMSYSTYRAIAYDKLQSSGYQTDPENLKNSLRIIIGDVNASGIFYDSDRRLVTLDVLHFDYDILLPKQSNFYVYLWTYTAQDGSGATGQGWKYLTDGALVIPAGTYFRLLFTKDRTSTTPLVDIYNNPVFKDIEIYKRPVVMQTNPNIRSVAHQGYSTTSQSYGNSRLSSYIGAKKHGFDYGECDIQFSSDGVPVCCHDASFDSNGTTVVIAGHTLAELKTYNYYGETIASLDEVVKLCKELGLGLYIDHLNGNWSDAYWNTIFGIVKKYQMQDNVYWLQGISRTLTTKILTWYKKAKIALVVSTNNLTSAITEANEIKTDFNSVSIDFDYSNITTSDLESYLSSLNAGIELEAWTIDNSTSYMSYLPYLKAITSNKLCYNDFYKQVED